MQLIVIRFSDSSKSTSGMLFEAVKGKLVFLCYTLEDEKRIKKVKGETRVPEGTYNITLRTTGGFHEKYSERFSGIHRGMLHITDVPNFEYILIHCGNTDEDTSGCLLVGDTQENNTVVKKGFIGKSSKAYKRIYPKIASAIKRGDKVTMTYASIDGK